MFYNFIFPLSEHFSFLNIFQYLTVRSGGALATSFLLSLVFGPLVIRKLKSLQAGSKTVRDDHPGDSVQAKAGTPSMGGVLILGSVMLSTVLWADLSNAYVWLILFAMGTFGAIGFVDDLKSLKHGAKGGLSGRVRLAIQAVCMGIVLYIAVQLGGEDATSVYIPFFKDVVFDLGLIGFILFGIFVVVGSANSVNLTDGLDGLVSVPAAVTAGAFAAVAYLVGRVDFSEYLGIAHVAGAGEITVFCCALVGGMFGFLWYNAPPARVFMGDTGSLAVGAALGTVAVLLKQEFMLAIVGGLFVLETVSVIVQVASFRLTGKRVFRMAPLHHHFEHKGWAEPTIVVRFWIISILMAIVGLATLKLR